MFPLEGSDFGSANYNRAECTTLADQGYANDTALAALTCDLSAPSKLVTRVLHIIDADGSHVANGTSRYRRTIQRKRQRPMNLAKPSKVSQVVMFEDKDIDVLSLTNLCSLFSYRLENSSKIIWRGRDQPQNPAHRRQFAGEPGGL